MSRRMGRSATARVLVVSAALTAGLTAGLTTSDFSSAAAAAPERSTPPVLTGPPPTSAAAGSSPAGRYHPLSPRLFHESKDVVRPGFVSPGGTASLHVVGANGVPAFGVRAVMIDVTASKATRVGRVDLVGGSSSGTPRVQVRPRYRTSNQMLAVPDANGNIRLRTSVRALLEVRMVGWVGLPQLSGPGLVQVRPHAKHVIDTTTGLRTTRGRLKARTVRSVAITAASGRPASAISAVVANVTVLNPTASGYLELYPGRRLPGRPQISLTRGIDASNQVILPVSSSGTVRMYLLSGKAHVKIDVQGYLTASGGSYPSQAAGAHFAGKPVRALDTRIDATAPARRTSALTFAGRYGVPANADAVLATVSVVGTSSDQVVVVGPAGSLASEPPSVWARKRRLTTATITIPLGPSGQVRLRRGNGDVVLDVVGWTVPAPLVVRDPDLDALASPGPLGPDAALADEVLDQTVRYAMGGWWDDVLPGLLTQRLDQGQSKRSVQLERHPTAKSVKNDPLADPVRRIAMTSFAVTTAIAADSWDAETIGFTEAVGLDRSIRLIQHLAATHISQRPNGWGGGVQGSLWAGYAGRAAWLVWDDLSAGTRLQVAEMISYEADDVTGQPLPYLRNDAGTVLRPGNSGAEEGSWTTLPVQLALAMMPTSEQRLGWNAYLVRNDLASWARPSDTTSPRVVNGAPVSAWVEGSNIEANGTLVNHNRIAPDYMANMSQTLDQVWVQATVGGSTPRAATALLCPVYQAFTQVDFRTPEYPSPGGKIYRAGGSHLDNIYYPEGIDWNAGMQLPYALIDAQIDGFGVCPEIASAGGYAMQHLTAARDMQARFTDGRTYIGSSEFNYVGREELTGQLAAQLVLSLRVRDTGAVSFTDATVGAL